MNAIRQKLKNGFGKKKSVHRPTGHPSVSATGSKPSKILKTESKSISQNRKSRKTKAEKSGAEPSDDSSQSMDRKSKKKSTTKNQKQRSAKVSKTNSLIEVPQRSSSRRNSKLCDSFHEGRLVLKTKLDIHIDQLFKMLFTGSKFFMDFQAKRQTTELQLGEWITNKDGQKKRLVNMTVALQGNIGPKTSKSFEEQILRRCSNPGELYSIDITCVNQGVPYADVFQILVHYCLIDINNKNTQMLVFVNVNFIKPTWAVIKTFITKHSLEALSIYFSDLQQELLKEISNLKKK